MTRYDRRELVDLCVTEVVYNHFVCGATLHGAPVAGRAGGEHSMIFQDPYSMVGVCWRGGGGRRACVHGLPRNAAEFRGMLVC